MTKFPYVYSSKPARIPVSRNVLALRFRQNWMAKHPVDAPSSHATGLDDSLTSLSWLQNLNIMKFTAPGPTPPSSPPPQVESASSDNNTQVNPNSVLNVLPQVKGEMPFNMMEVAPPTTASVDKIDYKTNPYVKPPYSYATLICMAMRETKKSKITLSGIYNWITENFMYYRMADPSWQNSIRHNLSLNKCFQKVARRKDEPGKGGFWRINPEFSDMFVNGIFKKRRGSSREPLVPPTKKVKRESDTEFLSVCLDEIAQQAERGAVGSDAGSTHLLTQPIKTEDNVVLGDVNWSTFLNQDIEVGGVKIKTERLIDDTDGYAASPITSLSPPPSDNSSEIGLEELLGSADLTQDYSDVPLDLTTGDALDLSISGTHINPPDWWSESMTRAFLSPEHTGGLHTPISRSPVPDNSHPWADDRTDIDQAFAAFDVDNLFDLGNIPSPRINETS